ncbi:response regulator [Piscinibacter sp.]|jgi:two-component system response regulator QseB|uniref:response regulator n=1 Tax=Piscinibacter sp. TaxID=1903157 RepID=UPI001B532B20|nr:response regulator [Piscinibacter sp.]MBK7531179.1 response regulator [Piscinibacter sp.]MBP6542976.1 response regulator [Piscinibacter sp.]
MHLLLVEDDLELGAELQRALSGYGLTSEWVRGTRHARAMTEGECDDDTPHFACVLLDSRLPDGDGIDLLVHWRRRSISMPVIVMSARDAVELRVAALDAGADDYVIKPCAPVEIASRIRAVVRRTAGQASQLWNVGALRIATGTREVRVDGEILPLSPKEYQIVVELARLPGETVSKQRLARAVAPLSEPLEFSALEWHIHNLRRKIGTQLIRTVRGVGYCLVND